MYGKLFTQMYDGTLATKGPWKALVAFQQLIILADKNGVVDMTAEAISRRTTIPLEIIEEGIKSLQEPDPDSRTPNEEGRRIALLSPDRAWGWQIVNYAHYRNLRSAEERRQYHQQYYHDKRKNKPVSTLSTISTDSTKAVSSKQNAVSIETVSISKSSNSKTKNNGAHAPLVLPDWIPEPQWNAWIEARTKRKNAPTEWAKKLAVRRLEDLKDRGHSPALVLAESAFNGWAGLFEPKGQK